MNRIRPLALLALSFGAACHEYRPADLARPRVEPARVEFATPQTVVLRRHTDSLLTGVRRLDGTLVWSDRDSLRIGVTNVELADGWRAVSAPSDAVIPMGNSVRVEHRVLSKVKTAGVLAAVWAGAVALIAANLK